MVPVAFLQHYVLACMAPLMGTTMAKLMCKMVMVDATISAGCAAAGDCHEDSGNQQGSGAVVAGQPSTQPQDPAQQWLVLRGSGCRALSNAACWDIGRIVAYYDDPTEGPDFAVADLSCACAGMSLPPDSDEASSGGGVAPGASSVVTLKAHIRELGSAMEQQRLHVQHWFPNDRHTCAWDPCYDKQATRSTAHPILRRRRLLHTQSESSL